ncbi:hypothetical protein V6N13_089509 [Hibiscus sabdariffa]|uniref:Uncharacterized protein n=1 Tax=Hibiscus sabdariffa TaxID=183260 RepID=A0ABR2QK56_9ROSI
MEGLTDKFGSKSLVGRHVGPGSLGPTHGVMSDGIDVVMGPLEEDTSLGDSESLKRPRTYSLQLVVSVYKDSSGASQNLLAGLEHGVSRSQ